MTESLTTTVTVNGQPATLVAEPRESLADALRRCAGTRSVRLGCEHGACGACTVLVDGRTARSCLMLAAQVDGGEVRTVEALVGDARFEAFVDGLVQRNAFQCGFCATGMLNVMWELFGEVPCPTEEQLRSRLSGNLCRCTGYQSIVRAVVATIEELTSTGSWLPNPTSGQEPSR
ncbi:MULTISPECIES: (2Fe-2S)-binding protein [unclassified Nocardioides]|uniref:(2Fe-2S)-binding protein n=1 Tax=unclassified Nocardioides TaxID=2615069 RepID=UPI0009F14205|nr:MULTISPECIES: 2Fe-2S iron-sulfur cluster-binding protein [unclassified Nocardioides]GAW49150.1 (2Fe-2S)-binding protein [Nocardioides sp. PD653-B2]GAW55638.1 (2Fe-2S)-binding protein [Nocardioides sp. PD653]